MVSIAECIRDLREFKGSLFENQLSKGPVPPSGPSLCHNKLNPNRDSKEVDEESFDVLVVGFDGPLKFTGVVTTEEVDGGYESVIKEVVFLNLGVVEKDREQRCIQKSNDSRV
ncbi:unnamed protein product [Lupinus luteus]|uniref:Uncharacterized protein n=1 Tax=Lupinus luteus TaxID=3873 RepID=A0AAV1X9Q5_LUPLU